MQPSTTTPITWIVVADGGKAFILKYCGPNQALQPIAGGELLNNPPSRDLADSKRGRVFQSASSARSAMERPTDPHQQQKDLFAHDIAHFLNEQVDQYDRLILTSAPKMLGTIRRCISTQTQAKITAELDKDLTQIAIQDLPKHLDGVINFKLH